MRGEQLVRQWRILRTIETRKNGATIAELAEQENCHLRTIWQDLAYIQNPQLLLPFQFNPIHDSQHQRKAQLSRQDLQRETYSMSSGGLVDVMSRVEGFGRHAEVLAPEHLREAVAQELAATSQKYNETHSARMRKNGSKKSSTN